MRAAARRILALGPRVVLVKGGHLPRATESVDVGVQRRAGVRPDAAALRARQHPRHRLHAVVGDRRAPGARARSRTRCDRARAYLDGAIRACAGSGGRSRAAQPFLAGILSDGPAEPQGRAERQADLACRGDRPRVTRSRSRADPLRAAVRRRSTAIGAVATFVGLVRDHNAGPAGAVDRLRGVRAAGA